MDHEEFMLRVREVHRQQLRRKVIRTLWIFGTAALVILIFGVLFR